MTNIDNDSILDAGESEDYKSLSRLIRAWCPFVKGWFKADDVDKQFNVRTSTGKQNRWIILERLVKKGDLRKSERGYHVIDKEVKHIPWTKAEKGIYFPFKWPTGRDDTDFGFGESIKLYSKEAIVFAGESNRGKTTMAYNIIAENVDKHHIRLMSNEPDARKLADRFSHIDWVDLTDEVGEPKFESLIVFDNHLDFILPDAINIIDWLNLGDRFWEVSKCIESYIEKLDKGIVIVNLQMTPGKDYGRGGSFGEEYASVYMTISEGLLKVKKVKTPGIRNPNGKMYHFSIEDYGSKFMDIYETKPCPVCHGYKSTKGKECSMCEGSGYCRSEKKPDYEELPF